MAGKGTDHSIGWPNLSIRRIGLLLHGTIQEWGLRPGSEVLCTLLFSKFLLHFFLRFGSLVFHSRAVSDSSRLELLFGGWLKSS